MSIRCIAEPPPSEDIASRLQDEAGLCRNETAEDIAALLDEGAQALLEARVLLDPIYELDPDIRRWFEKWSFTRIAVSAEAPQSGDAK